MPDSSAILMVLDNLGCCTATKSVHIAMMYR